MDEQQPTRAIELMTMLCGKWTTHILAAAAELNLIDVMGNESLSADEVARRAKTDPAVTYRLLRALANIGVLKHSDGDCFSVTELGAPLRADARGSLKSLAIMLGQPWHDRIWEALPQCARTGIAFGAQHALGMSLWQYFGEHPAAGAIFNAAMSGRSVVTNVTAVEAYDFSGIHLLCDVGGGHGRLLGMILQRHPGMRGILFDRPALARGAQAELASLGVLDRCEFVGGDFLTSVPSGADAYIMSHILHDWCDRDALAILRNCRSAVRTGGKLIVVDAIVKAHGERDWAKLLDLEMMACYGGRERTKDELSQLFSTAGFRLTRVIPTAVLDCIAEGTAV